MKAADLSDYNLGELKGLIQEIEIEIRTRQGQEVQSARDKIHKIAADLGISIEALLGHKLSKSGAGSRKDGSGTGKKVSVKYQNPKNAAEQWTGRGRKPKWVVDALASGKKIEELGV